MGRGEEVAMPSTLRYERCLRHCPQSLGSRGGGGNEGKEEVVVMGEGGGGSNDMAMNDAHRCFAACFWGAGDID